MDIYLARGDEQAGPFSVGKVEELIRSGSIDKTDRIWHEGLPTWCCLGLRAEYQAILQEVEAAQRVREAAATPPPIPCYQGPPESAPSSAATATATAATAAAASTTATALAATETAAAATAEAAPSVPKMYRPGMRAVKKESEENEEDEFAPYVKPVEDASKKSQLAAGWIDGLALWLCLWLLAAIFLPKGMSLSELAQNGDDDVYYDAYDDPEFEAKVNALEEKYNNEESWDDETSWDEYEAEYEALEKEWQEQNTATMDAGERLAMGTTTAEDEAKINRYYMIAAIFSLLFSGFQYFHLANKGQTLGKMFMDIKVINAMSQKTPGYGIALLIHTFYPRFKLADTIVVKA